MVVFFLLINKPDCFVINSLFVTVALNGECPTDQTRKIKKRRRRRTTSQSTKHDSTENSDEEVDNDQERTTSNSLVDSSKNELETSIKETKNEEETNSNITCEEIELKPLQDFEEANETVLIPMIDHKENETSVKPEVLVPDGTLNIIESSNDSQSLPNVEKDLESTNQQEFENETEITLDKEISSQLDISNDSTIAHHEEEVSNQVVSDSSESSSHQKNINHLDPIHMDTVKHEEILKTLEHPTNHEIFEQSSGTTSSNTETAETVTLPRNQKSKVPKYDLKPDAEEFVPRAYRSPDIPLSSVQFINIPSNFVPIPVFPFNSQNFNTAFIPPGIPINFIPSDPKVFQNFMGFPHNVPPYNGHEITYNDELQNDHTDSTNDNCDNSNTASDQQPQKSESEPVDKNKLSNKTIDIATVVSKLKVAAKEQEEKEGTIINKTTPEENISTNTTKSSRTHRFKNNPKFKGNGYIRSQNSPQREIRYRNRDLNYRNSPSRQTPDTNHSNNHRNSPSTQSIETNEPNGISFRYNNPVNGVSNSPTTKSNDSSKSSPKCSPFKQSTSLTNTNSPSRKNEENRKESPYKYKSHPISTVFRSPLASESLEVKIIPNGTASSDIQSSNFSRRSPEKSKKVCKQSYHSYNKWKQNNFTCDNKGIVTDGLVVETELKDKVCPKNYSEVSRMNAKREKSAVQINGDVIKKPKNSYKTEAFKVAHLPQNIPSNLLRSPNQWISVQKRKKRKSKNVEEIDLTDEIDDIQNDQFESYDVNLLVDVVLSPEREAVIPERTVEEIEVNSDAQHGIVEEVLTVVIETESLPAEISVVSISEFNDSEETERKEEIQEEAVDNSMSVVEVHTIPESSEDISSPTYQPDTVTAKDKKKKPKRNSQKPLKKKVIITDVDLSEQYVEIKQPVRKIVTKVEKTPVAVPSTSHDSLPKEHSEDEILKIEITSEIDGTFEKEASPESIKSEDQDEKRKSKKKKKKSPKPTNNAGTSTNDSVLGSMEDTFDFLDSALSGETEDKTNDEISEELDKIIQKGMLNSIEGKIKSLNIDETDGFFKSVWNKLSRKETNMGYTKIPDFREILKSSTNPQSVSEEVDLQNKNSNEILPHLDSVKPTTEDGLFLETPDLVEILDDHQTAATTPHEAVESKKEEEIQLAKHEIEFGDIEQPNTLYPITKAVKEWMSRTRETTPDVELLKSPNRIFEEFCDISDSDSETENGDSARKVSIELTPSSDITIFNSEREQSVEQQDLLEYWEDDVQDKENKSEVKTTDEDEEELPVYESQYGKNEDFLRIQRKIFKQNETWDRSSPNHASLPQRAAVCCNLM